MKNLLILTVLIGSLVTATKVPQQYIVNLDDSPDSRFKKLAFDKSHQINSFLDYLHNDNLYSTFFFFSSLFENYLSNFFDYEFYQQCKGIAQVINRKTSQIIIFNYMYELGAFHDFCTSISLKKNNGQVVLGRNLDYGFQQYLANSSIIIIYKKREKEIFRIAGHAGMIGTHTGMRRDKYAITLNQRVDGPLHQTIYSIITGCHEVPYLLRKTFEKCQTTKCIEKQLEQRILCAPVYFIIANNQTNAVIQRNRDDVHRIYHPNDTEYSNFIVQTNSDRMYLDPDKRRITAQQRLSQYTVIQQKQIFNVLEQYPNLNPLTLLTVVMNPHTNYFNTTIWY